MTYDTAKIRQFLDRYFNDEELEDLCFDYFREVSRNFTANMTKNQKIRLLLEYCDKYKRFPDLLTVLEKVRSTYYLETFPAQVTVDSTPYDNISTSPDILPPINTKRKPPGGYAQNDGGLRKRLATLRSVPLPVWGVIAVVLVLTWAAYSGLGGDNPEATPTTELAQNSPAATQPVPPSVTSAVTSTITNVPVTSTFTSTPTPVSSATPTLSRTPTPPAPTAIPDPNVPPANASLGDTWTRPIDDMVMVYVPPGTFQMGSTQNDIDTAFTQCDQMMRGLCEKSWFESEIPRHSITLHGFWLDRTEVTSSQFATFLSMEGNQEEGGVNWLEIEDPNVLVEINDTVFTPKNDFMFHPINNVSWYGARAYCIWAGGQLPTEAQWEYAARGSSEKIYPWGDNFDYKLLNAAYVDGFLKTSPVGSFSSGASWVGAFDLAGNVWEWVNDWYDSNYYSSSPTTNPEGPNTGLFKVARGGGWYNVQPILRSAYRFYDLPNVQDDYLGFRCVVQPGS